jgi:zinc protease
MFKGTPHHTGVMAEFKNRGFEFNGSTSEDRTNYFASMAQNDANLDWYLRWLADALVNSNVARKDLDSEMTVVRNEMESGENNPSSVLYQKTIAAAYWWHAYGHVPIGARSDVENVDITHLQAFYHKYYQPDNAVLIVTGKFDPAKTLAIIADTFAKIPRPARVIEPTYTLDPVQDGEHAVTVRRVGGAPVLYAMYHIPAGSDPRYAAAILSLTILGGNEFRLSHSVIEKGLAADAGAEAISREEPGVALFYAELKADQPIEPARDALLATAESVAAAPFTADELARAKNVWMRGFDNLLADPERLGIGLSEYVALGDWRLLFFRRDTVKAATLAEVNDFAQAFFVRSNRTLGVFIPTPDPVRAPALARVDVQKEMKDFKDDTSVSAGEAFDSSPENLEKRTTFASLPNDIRLGLLSKKTRSAKVEVRINLRFGDEKSLFGKDMAASLAAAMLSHGTERLSREQLAAEFERLQTSWSVGGSAEGATLSLKTDHEHLAAAMKLGIEVLRHPRFDEKEFEQVKSATIQAIQADIDDPQTVLGEKVAQQGNPYPKGDVRYPETSSEELDDLKIATIDEARNFYREFYGATDAVITAVGEFDEPEFKSLVNDGLSTWVSAKPYTRVPRPFYALPAAQLKIETPDKQNALMLVKTTAPLKESDREFQALRVATEIFGGGAAGGSRLADRIRQKDGLSYSVGAFASGGQFNANSSWEAEAIFAPQNQARVRADFYEELARAQKDGFTLAELNQANEGIRQELRLARAQDTSLVGLLASLIERNEPISYLTQVQKLRDSLSVAEINAAFRKYVVPDGLVFGVAGDFAAKTPATPVPAPGTSPAK